MRWQLDKIGFHLRHAGWRLPLFMVLMTLNGVIETVGIAMFVPLVELSMGNRADASQFSRHILSFLESINVSSTLGSILIIMCAMFAAKGMLLFGSRLLMAIMRIDLEESQRMKLTELIWRAKYDYLISRKVSDFSAIFDTEIRGVLRNLQALTQVLGALGTVAVYVAAAFWVAPFVGGVSVVFGCVLGIAVRGLTRRIQDASRKVSATNLEVESQFLDYLNAYKYLKATDSAAPILRFIRATLERRRRLFVVMSARRAILDSALEPLAVIVVAIFIFTMVDGKGHGIGPILLSLVYLYRSLSRVGTVHQSWQTFATSIGSVEAVHRFYEELEKEQEHEGGRVVAPLKSRLQVENVSVTLAGRLVLNDVSMEIAKGQIIGLVGESGTGKSTLADVIAGLRVPCSGRVLRDGVDMRDLDLAAVRSRTGYVTQEPALFHDTVAANVTLWKERPSRHADASPRLLTALGDAQALEFVTALPRGVATEIGARGHRLSGGQVQRLAIAREFYREVDLLIFDEAGSALDAHTDHAVVLALRKFAEKHAVLIISHRISTLRFCDLIHVMESGRIERSGSWSQLCGETNTWFARALHIQKAEQEPAP